MTLGKMPFENIVGKRENAGNQHFLLFPQYFKPFSNQISIFLVTFVLTFAIAFNLEQSKIVLFGKELTLFQTSPGFYVSAVQDFQQEGHDGCGVAHLSLPDSKI